MEKKTTEEVLKPIIIKDVKNNISYTLTFTRESVMYAERQGFNIQDLETKALTGIYDLWFYAFRANHKGVSRDVAVGLLEQLGGMPDGLLERLVSLYAEPYKVLLPKESESKNSNVVVDF